jgi:NCS1 family nucleobase:cation symporter-1
LLKIELIEQINDFNLNNSLLCLASMTEKEASGITRYDPVRGQVDLTKGFPEEKRLWNDDLHPTPISRRNWGSLTFLAIWVGMAVQIPSWTIGSVGFIFGLDWLTIIILMFAGNLVTLVPLLIQSHGGARYGIAEPQLTRVRWGIYGAYFPSWLRAFVATGWYGIQSYILTEAAVGIFLVATGQTGVVLDAINQGSASPLTLAQLFPQLFWTTFAIAIGAQIALLYFSPPSKSQPALKWFIRIAAPLTFIGLVYIFSHFMGQTNWDFTPITQIPATAVGHQHTIAVLAFLNANVGLWITMALSMPDFTRFAKSQFSQTVGQLPMPLIMIGIGTLGVLTTGATMVLFQQPIWDPVLLATVYIPELARIPVLLGIVGLTFSVNILANTIAPAYDIANSYPKYLTWFRGVLITVAISLGLGAWTFYGDAYNFLFGWLLTYGALLGAVEGVIIFDYAIVRRFRFELADIFMSKGKFRYWKGVNPAAAIAFIVTALILFIPYPGQDVVFANSWISSFLIGGAIYVILMAAWIIPKYQSHLKGNLVTGYVSEEVKDMFSQKPDKKLATEK